MNIKKQIDYKNISSLRKNFSGKIVLAHGTFDFFHYGHLIHLKKARSFGDKLVVSITSDSNVNKGPGRPLYSINERINFLTEFSFVDHVVISEFPTGVEIIKKLKPDFYVKGIEYKNSSNDFSKNIIKEKKIALENGAKIKYTNQKVFSSSSIINLYKGDKNKVLNNYILKNKIFFKTNYLIKTLRKIKTKNILVIGETILDEYIFCEGLGKSPKEEIISTRIIDKKLYLGGILATASHISNFCKKVTLLSVLGNDSKLNKLVNQKLNKKIIKKIFLDKSIKTIKKTRYLQNIENKKLFQSNEVHFNSIDRQIEVKIIKYLKINLKKFDAIIVNDFGHGLLTKKIINEIEKFKKKLCINVQTNSANLGYNFFHKYKKCYYLSIDEPEARLGTGDRFCKNKELFKKVYQRTKYSFCSITHGGNGAKLSHREKIYNAPALTKTFTDTLGAGDAYFSISSLFALFQKNPEMILLTGNIAGAVKINYLGHENYIDVNKFYSSFKSSMA